MKSKRITFLLAALLLLVSCGKEEPPEGLCLWFPTDLDSPRHRAQAVTWEPLPPAGTGESDEVEALVSALLDGPSEDGLTNPFPAGARLLGWNLREQSLELNFSEEYGSLTGVDMALADCCLVLTLCQLEQVDQVCLLVEGRPAAGRVLPALSPEDVIFTGAEEKPRQIDVALYFPRAMGKGLGLETRELTLTEDDDLYETIAHTLLKGPTDPDLQTFLPGEDALIGVWMDNGVCYVNFSAEFLNQSPEGEAEQNLLLFSVVDTLGNLDSVTAVQLLVEGERLPEFGGAETNLPLEPDFGLLSGG